MSEPASAKPALIEEEFARLCASDVLRRAPSHMRLLRYLVDKRVVGDASALRERAIALEVFRRDPAVYDPQSDPIVRVTAGRLRARLDAHYARYDAPPKLRIVLPRGGYAPEFVALAGKASRPEGLAVFGVRNDTGRAELDPLCRLLALRLTGRLARLGVPRVVARESVATAEAQCGDRRAIGHALRVEWLLDMLLAREGDGDLRVTARLLHAIDGGVQWIETRAAPDAKPRALLDALADRVHARFAATLGNGGAA